MCWRLSLKVCTCDELDADPRRSMCEIKTVLALMSVSNQKLVERCMAQAAPVTMSSPQLCSANLYCTSRRRGAGKLNEA